MSKLVPKIDHYETAFPHNLSHSLQRICRSKIILMKMQQVDHKDKALLTKAKKDTSSSR